MARKVLIQIRRGLEEDIGTLNIGELGYCTDTSKLYIGTVTGNVLLVAAQTAGDMLKSIYDTDNDGVVERADAADKLSTARTITLSGDVIGSATFDGSSNVSMSVTVDDDVIALIPVGVGYSINNGSTRPTLGTAAVDLSYSDDNTMGATGDYSHAEGFTTTASGMYCHAEGKNTEALRDYSHAEGIITIANGRSSHAEGHGTIVTAYSSPVISTGSYSITVESAYYFSVGDQVCTFYYGNGYEIFKANITAINTNVLSVDEDPPMLQAATLFNISESSYLSGAHAEGTSTQANGDSSHAEGEGTTASSDSSHAEGFYTTSAGFTSHAEGYYTTASGNYSHAEGAQTIASGEYSHASGRLNTAKYAQTVIGHCSVESSAYDTNFDTSKELFIIGNGSGSSFRGNAFKVLGNGATYADGAYSSTGADYAEYFEWGDGNPDNEDRVGFFVTLEGEKIRKANSNDEYVLGVISASPAITGDNQERWYDKFITDNWGRIQYHYIDVPADTRTIHHETELDEDGNIIKEPYDETIEISPARQDYVPILNPAWDSEQEYISRENRPEWSAVGLMGKLLVFDDGTCQVDGFCKPNDEGAATLSNYGYRVMERVSDNIIKILVK